MLTALHPARFPYHTLLFSVYPILYLYSQNSGLIPFSETLRTLGWSLGMALLFLLVFRLALKSWERAGGLASLFVAMLFSFGHVANALEMALSLRLGASLPVAGLAWAWFLALLALIFAVLRGRPPAGATRFLNLTGLALVLLALAPSLVSIQAQRLAGPNSVDELARWRSQATAEAAMPAREPSALPDIYYIIIDGYTSADQLQAHYSYDNSAFISALETRGFYVAAESRTNYLNTIYSLNTSLNLVYYHDFPRRLAQQARYNLQTNYVNDFLHRQGYSVVVFDSGSADTNNQPAEIFVHRGGSGAPTPAVINTFEQLFIRTTLAIDLFRKEALSTRASAGNFFQVAADAELEERRRRIADNLERLPDYTTAAGPRFLFAHLLLPHLPFLYGPDQTPLPYLPEMNYQWYQTAPPNYVEYYRYQIDYLNTAVLAAVDAIQAQSTRPLVIVIQSDHGDDGYLNWRAPDARGVDVRSSILNAIYFSDGAYQTLYPTLTPVNTFRLVFNHWFGTQFPLLPDRVYVGPHPLATPHTAVARFTDACASFAICLPAPAR